MRVIAGRYRGRKLETLEGMNTRPTTARVKEDMFNILSNWFYYNDKVSLDLFGGSGALSIEGLSRGVKFAYINDFSIDALKIIKKNLRDIDTNQYKLFNWDYKRVLEHLEINNVKVDLIYLDPPFRFIDYYYSFFDFIHKSNILNINGVVMTESEKQLNLEKLKFLKLLRYKDFKNKHFYLFRLEEK